MKDLGYRDEFAAGFYCGSQSGDDILRYARACELEVTWARRLDANGRIWALLLKPQSRHLVDGFGLQFEVLMLCSGYPEFQPRLLDRQVQVRELVGTQGRFHENVIFVVSGDPDLESKTASLTKEQIIVPLTPAQMMEHLASGSPSSEFRAHLQRYMYSRDFFDKSGPVSGEDFFGRERLLQDIATQLARGSNVGFYGLRKVGKTSILRQLRERAPRLAPTLVPVHIDLLSVTPANRTRFFLLWLIAQDLVPLLAERNIAARWTLLGSVPKFSEITDLRSFEKQFDEDFRLVLEEFRRQGIRLVLMFDEIERLFRIKGRQDGFDGYDLLLEYLRGLSQTTHALSLLVVGVNPHISEASFIGTRDNPVFGFFTTRFATPLESDELASMIRSLGKMSGASFTHDAVARVHELTGGHPYLARLLCSFAIQGQTRPCEVSRAHIDGIEEGFVRQESSKLAEMVSVVKEYYPAEFELLHRIAVEGTVKTTDVAEHDLAHLEGYQLVQVADGNVQLRNVLMRRWLVGLSEAQARAIAKVEDVVTGRAGIAVTTISQEELREMVENLERTLRGHVRKVLEGRWRGKAGDRIRSAIGPDEYQKAVDRREKTIRRYDPRVTDGAADILEFCYIGDLAKIICGNEWELFRKTFGDKARTQRQLENVAQARNELFHGRTLPHRERLRCVVDVSDLFDTMQEG